MTRDVRHSSGANGSRVGLAVVSLYQGQPRPCRDPRRRALLFTARERCHEDRRSGSPHRLFSRSERKIKNHGKPSRCRAFPKCNCLLQLIFLSNRKGNEVFQAIRILFTASAVATVLVGVTASTWAGGSCHSNSYQPPACYYKTVTVWETISKPYVHDETQYDHCGHPYHVSKTIWKTVRVPVTKRVKVCY